MMQEYDLVVIGGGSAGMKAARTAARMGKSVAMAEERELGGECFWAGCVPTKALVRAADVWHLVRNSAQFGIHANVRKADFREAMAYKDRAVAQVGGTGAEPDDARLRRIGIAYYHTRATFCDSNVVQMGRDVVRAKKLIIATGTIPHVPYVDGLEDVGYITNREAVALLELPKHLIVLGGGPIGLEFAQVYRRFGADVTVVEVGPQILPKEDAQIAELVTGYLREEGIRVITNAETIRAARTLSGKSLVIRIAGVDESLEADEILVATGRAAAVGDLDLDSAGVRYSQRCVDADDFLKTNQPHILVAGDAAGGYLFTHVASYEGRLAAENAFSEEPRPYNPRVVPRATFVDPEVASIGYTPAAAIDAGIEIAIQSFSFADLDRAILHGDPRGIVKLVIKAKTHEIIGGHIVGQQASALIAEIALAMSHRLPVQAIADTMHAYPSFPEAIEAAALSTPSYVGRVEE
jgi:pyruvate/2-oxoglutarate dehydrogenase complex dihydrolipoamide dehydrogenase (E3) component